MGKKKKKTYSTMTSTTAKGNKHYKLPVPEFQAEVLASNMQLPRELTTITEESEADDDASNSSQLAGKNLASSDCITKSPEGDDESDDEELSAIYEQCTTDRTLQPHGKSIPKDEVSTPQLAKGSGSDSEHLASSKKTAKTTAEATHSTFQSPTGSAFSPVAPTSTGSITYIVDGLFKSIHSLPRVTGPKSTPQICQADGITYIPPAQSTFRPIDAIPPTSADNKHYGYSELMHAAKCFDIRTISHLLEERVDINQSNLNGDTAMLMAVTTGHAGLVLNFLRAGADPYAANKAGFTPFSLAVWLGHANIVASLLAEQPELGLATKLYDSSNRYPPISMLKLSETLEGDGARERATCTYLLREQQSLLAKEAKENHTAEPFLYNTRKRLQAFQEISAKSP